MCIAVLGDCFNFILTVACNSINVTSYNDGAGAAVEMAGEIG